MITSTANSQVKYLEKIRKKGKVRRQDGVFLIEGERIYLETPKERIQKAYIAESLYRARPDMVAGVPFEVLSDSVFAKAADTLTPQGIMALVHIKEMTRDEVLREEAPLYLVLDGLQDPGNLGTIMRTAEGAGVTAVIMSPDTVDIYNPKVIRATMGSIYRVPFFVEADICALLGAFKMRGIKSCAAHLNGVQDYDQESYLGGTAFLIGNEGNGLRAEVTKSAETLVKIPMAGELESLNAAMAAGLLMYEAARQRRHQ